MSNTNSKVIVSTVHNIPTRIKEFVFGAQPSDEDAGNKDSQLSAGGDGVVRRVTSLGWLDILVAYRDPDAGHPKSDALGHRGAFVRRYDHKLY